MATKRENVPTQSWSSKSAVFFMESALTSNGTIKLEQKAVGRQRNLGLVQPVVPAKQNPHYLIFKSCKSLE
jgi:hypothetical protein